METYKLQLGWLNTEEAPGTNKKTGEPVDPLYIDGKCWMTKDSLPVMIPDNWKENVDEETKAKMIPLPNGTIANRINGDNNVEVIYD